MSGSGTAMPSLSELSDRIASGQLCAPEEIKRDIHMLRRALWANQGERRFLGTLAFVIMACAEFKNNMFWLTNSIMLLSIPIIGVSYQARYEKVCAWFKGVDS